jgi:hypothetical protein
MQVHTAQLPGAETSADRVLFTSDAMIVLDGTSAFLQVDVEPGTYAETLGRNIAAELNQAPGMPITDAVAEAIRRTTEKRGKPLCTARVTQPLDHRAGPDGFD